MSTVVRPAFLSGAAERLQAGAFVEAAGFAWLPPFEGTGFTCCLKPALKGGAGMGLSSDGLGRAALVVKPQEQAAKVAAVAVFAEPKLAAETVAKPPAPPALLPARRIPEGVLTAQPSGARTEQPERDESPKAKGTATRAAQQQPFDRAEPIVTTAAEASVAALPRQSRFASTPSDATVPVVRSELPQRREPPPPAAEAQAAPIAGAVLSGESATEPVGPLIALAVASSKSPVPFQPPTKFGAAASRSATAEETLERLAAPQAGAAGSAGLLREMIATLANRDSTTMRALAPRVGAESSPVVGSGPQSGPSPRSAESSTAMKPLPKRRS